MDLEQNKAVEKALQKVISREASHELANLEGEPLKEAFNLIYEQMSVQNLLPEEPTVKNILNELYDLTQDNFSDTFTITELQYLIFEQVETLAGLLGIELE
jgi:hypothetical protein